MKDETKKWLRKSREDMETAKILANNEKLPEAAFFLQQSIEKALKSLLIEKNDRFPRIHDLVSLGREVNIPRDLLEYCKELSPAYTYTRYPDVAQSLEFQDRIDSFIKHTKEVVEWIKKKV